MSDLKNITIEFGGFYGSIHEDLIEGAAEMMCDDDNGELDQELYNNFGWINAHHKYCVAYLSQLEDFISDELEIDAVKFVFIELHSPKFYNYSTDKIIATMSENDERLITDTLKEDEDFINYLEERTASVSGFISFYSFDEAMNNKDGVLIEYVMAFLCNMYNDDQLQGGIHEVNVFEAIC